MSRSGPGPFVYRGSGKVQSRDAEPSQRLCTKEACNIQVCLQRNNHVQDRCGEAIEVWRRCCDRVNAAAAAAEGEKS